MEKGRGHHASQHEANPHELHQTYGTLLSKDQTLKIRVTIHQILAIDLHEETFTVEFDVCFMWKDPRLSETITRVWLPEKAQGNLQSMMKIKTCNVEGGGCYCRGSFEGKRCSKLPFVEGIFTEKAGKDYIIEKDPEKPKGEGLGIPQPLGGYIYKEEPNFDDLGELFGEEGGASVLNFSKLMESPTVLNEHQRLSDGLTGEITLFRKMRACFKENMEVERFPFDRQLLQFKITASVPVHRLKLQEEKTEKKKKSKSVCKVEELPEYKVNQEENKEHGILSVTEARSVASDKPYSQAKVTIHVQRKPQKYMVNIVFMVFLLVLASCSSFAIPLDKTGERAGSIITYVLTIMALKYVISDQMPGKDYQTWLDLYLLFAYVLLIFPALELLVLSCLQMFWRPTYLDEVDSVCAILFFCAWVLPHVVLLWRYVHDSESFYLSWDTVRANQSHKKGDESPRPRERCRTYWYRTRRSSSFPSAKEPLLQAEAPFP